MPEDISDITARLDRIESLLGSLYGSNQPESLPRGWQEGLSESEREAFVQLYLHAKGAGPLSYITTKAIFNQDYAALIQIIAELADHNNSLRKEFRRWQFFHSLGLDSTSVRITRYIPLRVFVSIADLDVIDELLNALREFVYVLGFRYVDEWPAKTGSFFKEFFAKTKDVATQPEVKKRLEKGERALQLMALDKHQSEIDKNQAEAAATLIKATEATPQCALQIGSILYVKRTVDGQSTICARTLTPEEMIHLENNQSLLKRPNDILDELQAASSGKGKTRRNIELE